jgi:hypothetical protein
MSAPIQLVQRVVRAVGEARRTVRLVICNGRTTADMDEIGIDDELKLRLIFGGGDFESLQF